MPDRAGKRWETEEEVAFADGDVRRSRLKETAVAGQQLKVLHEVLWRGREWVHEAGGTHVAAKEKASGCRKAARTGREAAAASGQHRRMFSFRIPSCERSVIR